MAGAGSPPAGILKRVGGARLRVGVTGRATRAEPEPEAASGSASSSDFPSPGPRRCRRPLALTLPVAAIPSRNHAQATTVLLPVVPWTACTASGRHARSRYTTVILNLAPRGVCPRGDPRSGFAQRRSLRLPVAPQALTLASNRLPLVITSASHGKARRAALGEGRPRGGTPPPAAVRMPAEASGSAHPDPPDPDLPRLIAPPPLPIELELASELVSKYYTHKRG